MRFFEKLVVAYFVLGHPVYMKHRVSSTHRMIGWTPLTDTTDRQRNKQSDVYLCTFVCLCLRWSLTLNETNVFSSYRSGRNCGGVDLASSCLIGLRASTCHIRSDSIDERQQKPELERDEANDVEDDDDWLCKQVHVATMHRLRRRLTGWVRRRPVLRF